ncbi:MAG: ABC transporter substrate-binding protein [Verrucomicrobia bacterium]|nr:ABC transporter substrate-binding protein [Verrucomicrobiota bacterium]
MKSKRWLLLVPGAVLVALWSGCGQKASLPSPGQPLTSPLVAAGEPGQPGGRLTLTSPGVPQTFNPLLASDAASEDVIRLLFAPLVRFDPVAQTPQPALAESWTVEPDQRTWTFTLRRGLRWSDGQPLTAADVVFTWNEVMYNPDMNRQTYDLFRIAGRNFTVTRVDEQTVRVVTPEVFAPFLEFFGGVVILPEHAIGQAVRARRFLSIHTLHTRPERIVGSGPFRVKECQPGQHVLLERNPEYWVVDRQNRRLPYLDEVLLLASDSTTAPFLFFSGKTDLFERTRPEDYAHFQETAAGGNFRLVELGAGTERDFLWFNLNTNLNAAGRHVVNPTRLVWFQNKKFRQAVSCALDRDRIVREVYGGRAQPLHTFASAEDRKWNNPQVPLFAHDPARARALLGEIGIRDRDGDGVLESAAGAKLEFSFFTNSGNRARERTAALIAEDLGRIGMKVDLQLLPFTNLVDRIGRTFDYECILMGVGGAGSEPASQMNVLKSSEPLHQWFPEQARPATEWEARIDALMDEQMRTLDHARRKQHYDEVQTILAEELPMIFTVSPFHFAVVRADLGNLRPSALTAHRLTWNLEELFFRSSINPGPR